MSKNNDNGTAGDVRELIHSGKLPAHPPTRIWAGYGPSSDPCEICAALVPADQVVVEAVFGMDEGRSLFFHRECFQSADSEWRRIQGSPASAAGRGLSATTAGGHGADAMVAAK